MAALKLLLTRKIVECHATSSPSVDHSNPSSSEINSSVRQDSLVLRFFKDYVKEDVLPAIEEDPKAAYKHSDFLRRLHNPHTDRSTLDKVIT
ncbi:hypothetical protein A2U01_0065461, partial [Trifolium medium]|nr:hypothetical protein [Trifolium medium]